MHHKYNNQGAYNGQSSLSEEAIIAEKTLQDQREKLKKKYRNTSFALTGVIVVAVATLLMTQFNSGLHEQEEYHDLKERINVSKNETKVVTDNKTSAKGKEETLSKEYEWSNWVDELPKSLSINDYDIDSQTLYRSRQKETTISTSTNKMTGWELYGDSEKEVGFGNWSEWTTDVINASDSREVETQTRYRYADKKTTSGTQAKMDGWTLYDTTYSWGNYGAWSEWSTNAVYGDDSRKVEEKIQYRYRTLQTNKVYTDWVVGEWGEAEQGTGELCQLVATRTLYPYYYFCCTSCGTRSPYHGYTCKGCGRTTVSGQTGTVEWFEAPWSNSSYWGGDRYYQNINGGDWWNWTDGTPKNQWRYQTRSIQNVNVWSEWSSYSDTSVAATDTKEVSTRVVYRYCDRPQIPTYYFYKWDNWSEWSSEAVASSDNRQVEKATYYRYRDKVIEKVYYFYRWGEWSDWGTNIVNGNEDLEVEIKGQYRYKRKK